MRDQVDGRARVALVCAIGSLLVLLTPGAGLFFGLVGAIFAAASVISVDRPAGTRTRRVALAAGLVCVAAFVLGVAGAASIPQG